MAEHAVSVVDRETLVISLHHQYTWRACVDVACWPLVPKFVGSNPAEAVGFFRAKKSSARLPSFGREVKPFVPCRIFAACKRTRKCMRGSRSFRSKLPAISRPSSSSFHY